jgi:hypothetical protein
LYLARAFGGRTYNYEFSVEPGYHGFDLCYTFYPFDLEHDGVDVCDAVGWERPMQFQDYIVSFVVYQDPNVGKSDDAATWPFFGTSNSIVMIDHLYDFYIVSPDPELPEDRCAFWQPAPYRGTKNTVPRIGLHYLDGMHRGLTHWIRERIFNLWRDWIVN